MAKGEITPQAVPEFGPLQFGAIYRRSDLNGRFGGNTMTGIVPSSSEPVVLLFHTKEPSQQFYGDDFDADGVYWYSGKGAKGDMAWSSDNVAVRDHEASGRDLFFFERAQRKDGLWRFTHLMNCVDCRTVRRPGSDGVEREAILFGLVPVESSGDSEHASIQVPTGQSLAELRHSLKSDAGVSTQTTRAKVERVFKRSALVIEYALRRADGTCEACKQDAPFVSKTGTPYLEVHHLLRLADGGPDRFDCVAAVCPNCHRRCHYGIDALEFNKALICTIESLEQSMDAELV